MLFFITYNFISKARLKLAKNQAKTKQHPGADFCYLKIIHFLYPRYHPRIIEDILKKYEKHVRLFK